MDPDELEIQHQAKQLRELFKGRFTQNELVMVIKEFGGKLPALDFIIREDPGVVSQFLKKNKSYIQTLQQDSQNLCRCLEEGINIESSKRQFACRKCERSWWKVVPIRKEVSMCRVCRVKFDPIPRDKEWGIGVFYCLGENCGKEFRGFAVMGMTESMCHRCGFDSPVDHILPPRKKTGEERRTRDNHGCNGINCYNG
ncbi:unnamed protein product [Lymnaea stagnalis]|uniref:Uncharacterized protein n=1 Tax=Lymnaea stagnalis TaxID=6523 RepID=A0AAV2H541_LYMST